MGEVLLRGSVELEFRDWEGECGCGVHDGVGKCLWLLSRHGAVCHRVELFHLSVSEFHEIWKH